MRNLLPLPDDPLAVFDAVRQHVKNTPKKPRATHLYGLRDRLARAYRRYHEGRAHLERLKRFGKTISGDQAEALIYAYKFYLRDGNYGTRILALSEKCFYCGINRASMLDHYLPKGGERSYPELALLPVNLVPSCHPCNPPRDFRDERGRRALVHPYFDRIPGDRLLFADVRVVGGDLEATFRVDLARSTNREFGRLYKRHVELLHLLKTYEEEAGLETGLPSLRRRARTLGKWAPRHEVVASLLEDAMEEEQVLGANHFHVVLTRGAADSSEFLDHCLGGMS